jgi:predicted kinase
MRRALVLTGGPAAGKSTCARELAARLDRAAVVDVDDIRQLVVAGAAAPWEGAAGDEQRSLGATNACALARNFLAAGFDTVIADVLTPRTAKIYRRELRHCLIAHLRISLDQARERAATRPVYITNDEFEWVHHQDLHDPPAADLILQVDSLSISEQVAALSAAWSPATR